LELLLFQVLPHPAALERGGEEHGQRVARRGAGLVGAASLARRVEEPPAGERQAAVTPGRAVRLEDLRQAVAHRGLALQQVPLLQVEAGGGGAALLAPEVEQPLQELALVRVVAGEGQQLVPGLDDHAGRRGALHVASRIQSTRIWATANVSSAKMGAYCARPMMWKVFSIVGVRQQNPSLPLISIIFSMISMRIEMPIELTILVPARLSSSTL